MGILHRSIVFTTLSLGNVLFYSWSMEFFMSEITSAKSAQRAAISKMSD
jgi:hypothetical protein